jgi:hypothetical protein
MKILCRAYVNHTKIPEKVGRKFMQDIYVGQDPDSEVFKCRVLIPIRSKNRPDL